MTCLVIGGYQTGIASTTVTDTEFDAVSVVAGGTLTPNSANEPSDIYALNAATGGTNGVSYGEVDWGSDETEIYLMVRVKFSTVPSAITAVLAILDSTPTQLFALRVNASGFWQINNNANSTVYTSTLNKPLANVTHRIEIYWKQDATTGALTVKIDGVQDNDLTQTGLNNGAAKPRRIRVGVVEAQTNAPTRYVSHWIVNSTGGSLNNSWVGLAYVRRLHTIAANTNNWTVVDSGKANWQCMQELPWNSNATDMIKTSTANQEEIMQLVSMATSSTGLSVIGIIPVLRHRRAVAGSAAGVTVNIKSGSSNGTASGTLDSGSTTWKTFRGVIQETDPATSAAWTVSALQSALLRIVHDSGTNEADINACHAYVAYTEPNGVVGSSPKASSMTHAILFGKLTFPLPARFWERGRKKHKADNYRN